MSEFSRETLLNIIETDHVQCGEASALARMALVAMGSEPVAIIDQANLDYLRSGADADVWPPEREEMGDVLLYRHAQPAPVSYSDFEEFWSAYIHPLAQDDELKDFSWGIWNACVSNSQPAPVVPDGYVMVPKEPTDEMLAAAKEWTGLTSTAEAVYIKMLAAAPQLPGSEPATVPGKWIPVSERMPEREVDVQVYCPDKKEQMVAYLERNELDGYFRFATWRTGDGIYCQPTHWMPLPAAPQEVNRE
ncbi:TPA: DUF551 domain-containing protein [Klebsiella pneumoniae]|nr:DUF551 domain-containing protein [Klebsiella pneumoniae]DAF04001.1 MAG TPA: Protein of unknown function (DUF551) [Caudoviricetes sp.]EJO3116778.1 DUF551 domain-containing protein [Klebsiella pneumoniae]MBE0162299.1 DUF551 domain-containing protein [Klebsiella pneumoniae]MBK1598762.1 DUF551 domain-containing protein [Klebsiella pneumoniae]SVR50607.1 Eaa1 [Klebsiella pneumoniae]